LFGPALLVHKLGAISEGPPCKRQKQGKNATGEFQEQAQADTVVVNSVVWIELVSLAASFDAAHTGGLPLPQNIGEARKFVEVIDNFFKAFPACFGYDSPARRAATSRKSIQRKIVLWAQSLAGVDGRHDCSILT
jgi:hypothetical protein